MAPPDEPLLPSIETMADYEAIYRETDRWLPAMVEIARRHDLPAERLERAADGTNIVFFAGPAAVVKMFCPLWAGDVEPERLVLEALSGAIGLGVPTVRAAGAIEGWPYLVLARLPGVSIGRVWQTIAPDDQRPIARRIGQVIARIHALPIDGLEPIARDWPTFMAGRIERVVDDQRGRGLGEEWLARIPAFVASLPPFDLPAGGPVLVTADLTSDHLLLDRPTEDSPWRLTGLIDLADALVGHPLYEFAAPFVFLTGGRPDLRHALLDGYGLPVEDRTADLSRAIAGYAVLHLYGSVAWMIGNGTFPYRSLDDLVADVASF